MKNRNLGPFDERFEYAAALEENGKFAEALDQWRQLASDYKETAVLGHLGSLAQQLGYLEEAESAFHEAIQIDDKESNAYVGLASVLIEKSEYEGASQVLQKALNLEKTEYTYTMLGAALIGMGKDQEAIENLEAALVLDPAFDEAYFNLGVIKSKTDPAEGERLILKALELDPEYAAAHQELGWLLNTKADFPKAEYHLRRAIQLEPDRGYARIYLGNLLWRRGDVAAAVSEFEEAIRYMPDRAMSFCALANVYEDQELWEEAEQLYEKAIEIEPDDTVAHMNFGRMLSKRGDSVRAATHLKHALLLDPDYSAARKLLAGLGEEST